MTTNIATIKFLTEDEVRRVLKALRSKRDKAIILLAVSHGLRIGEVRALQRDNFDERTRRLRVDREKGGRDNWQPMHPEAFRTLQAYLRERTDDAPWLFIDNRGAQLQTRALDQVFRRAATKAGLPEDKRHFHTLRHTCATDAISAGADLRFVQMLLGHRDVHSTTIYAQIVNPAFDKMARTLHSKRRYA